ncbi:substrate-binding domain-containing protein [Mucilaginibacter sp.]|uniref:PstS family phosphate ABC transporter substrate-binding protein n=1 Tax=Mucilaginibacter sp. TaxID=1882438 RepID=UPI0025EF5E1C|nr:substrate-binding domain-containing protein [Mucilaginibacter sp.]
MKYSLKIITAGAAWLALFASCEHKVKTVSGVDRSKIFVVDESLKPIVDQELYVYGALYKDGHPKVIYAPENNAVNMLFADSARVLLMSREMTAEENKVLKSKNISLIVNCFAIDAIALIVNQASNDTTITVSEIKKMLTGDTKTDKDIVFDNPNSGLVRYLKEFSGTKEFKQKNIYSLKSNKEVVQYVSTHPNAIGITGFSWLNDPEKDYEDAVNKVKIVSVKDDSKPSGQYFLPSQESLALKQYPLTRKLYILNFTGKMGLGMEFAAFIAGDRGQRIILKSGLLPFDIPGREVNIVKKIVQ